MFLTTSRKEKKKTCAGVSFLIKLLELQETPALVVSKEFCEMFKNTFFVEHLWPTAANALPVCRNFFKVLRKHPRCSVIKKFFRF